MRITINQVRRKLHQLDKSYQLEQIPSFINIIKFEDGMKEVIFTGSLREVSAFVSGAIFCKAQLTNFFLCEINQYIIRKPE